MQRYILHTPVVRWYGLYYFQQLSLEQARIWLDQGTLPVVRQPSLASVVASLTGRHLTADPSATPYMRADDEALVVELQESVDVEDLTAARRVDQTRFALLRMVAGMTPFSMRIAERDLAAFALPGQRSLLTHAWLEEPGAYAYTLLDRFAAQVWLDAGPYQSMLRYDVVGRALTQLTACSNIPLQEEGQTLHLTMAPGDEALSFHLAFPPGVDRPKPYAPDPRRYSDTYLLAHSEIGLLTRLSETFFERHYDRYPYAQAVPRLRSAV